MFAIRTSLLSLSLAIVVLVALALPASAQRAAGPYEGVLGSTDDAAARHTLVFRASGYGVWEHILRETADPSRVAIELDLDTTQQALAFCEGLETVWATPRSQAQLVSHEPPVIMSLVESRAPVGTP